MQELKANEMHKPERCSNCMFNTKAPCGLYFCNNSDSELFHKTTGYDMSCEYWIDPKSVVEGYKPQKEVK